MARKTEEANVVVTMNGEAAKKVLAEMTAKMDEYRAAAAKAYVDGDKAVGDAMTKKMKQLEKEIRVSKGEMRDFSDVVKSLNSKSIRELTTASKQLQAQLKNLAPNTQEFIEKSKQLQQVNTRLNALKQGFKGVKEEVKESSLSLKGLADGFNKYFGMVTAGIAAITGVSMAFRKSAEEAAQLDDVYSDVMKTTGLAHDEVQALDEELMKLDTRTSREQLLLLARDAGKLGIQGSENILGFVRAADKIQVALGEDLGEGAIRNLGKIADVFGYTKTKGIEDSLLSIGSAINAVGQASTANEAYLVDFTQRLAGVGAQTGISAANIIGFASGLDQSAMKVEMAATAFQTFLTKLYEDPAKFAQYAGMQVKEFTDLLNNDANTAVITILKNLKDQDGFAALVPIFKDMGVDGARATSVLAAMASNLTAITDAQSLANVEFEKATSLADEFATKNNNMQASLDKARKEFKNASIALGQSLNPILLKSTNATTYLIKALANYGKEIKTVIVVIAALTAALKLKVIWQKVVATWNATLRAGSLALAAAQALLAGNVSRAAAAWKMMSVAMKATIFGAVTAAITALVFAISKWANKQKEVNELMKIGENLEKRVSESCAEEASRVKALHKIIENNNISLEQRNAALKELKEIVPGYHASLSEEGKLIEDNKEALDEYLESLRASTRAKLLQTDLETAENAVMSLENKLEEAKKKAQDALIGANGNAARSNSLIMQSSAGAFVSTTRTPYGVAMDEVEDLEKKLEIAQAKSDEILSKIGKGAVENVEIVKEETQTVTQLTEMATQEVDKQVSNLKNIRRSIHDQIQEMMDVAEADRDKRDFSNYRKSDINDPKANDAFWNEIYAKRDSIVASLEDKSLSEEYEIEMMWLDKLHQHKLLSEETYQKAVLKTKLNYAQKAAEQTEKIASAASSFVSSLQNAELANAEAAYQAQLTAAGDNAEQREKIEAAYEQRKLDIQKKYADADMVMNIAKTTANGAVAAIRAYAEGGPYAGPILAAIIAATTAAEIATIIAQRNAIKNSSVSSSGSGSGLQSGIRTINEGYAEGGYTGAGGKYEAAGIVHRGEWVAPKWMVKQNPVTFANLERYRRSGSHGRSGSSAHGFADGGYTSPVSVSPTGGPIELSEASAMMIADAIAAKGITIVQLDKALSDKHAQDNRFKKITAK